MPKNTKSYTTVTLKISDKTNSTKLDIIRKIAIRDTKIIKFIVTVILKLLNEIKEKNGKLGKYDMDNYFLSTELRKVPFDVKDHYHLYTREYQDIRDNAVENVKAYEKTPNKAKSLPFSNGKTKPLTTRRMTYQKLKQDGRRHTGTVYITEEAENSISSLWLHISDSISYKFLKNENRRNTKKLKIPIQDGKKFRQFMLKYNLDFNDICTITISEDGINSNQWLCHLAFETPQLESSHCAKNKTNKILQKYSKYKIPNPSKFTKKDRIAVFSYDPGLRVPYTGVILTPYYLKKEFVRVYRLPEAQRRLHELDKRISTLQSKLNLLLEEIKSSFDSSDSKNLVQLDKLDKLDNRSLQKLKNRIRSQLLRSGKSNNHNHKTFYLESQLNKLIHTLERTRKKWFAIRQQSEYLLAQAIQAEVLAWEMRGWQVHVVIGYPKGITENVMHTIRSKVLRRQTSRWRYRSRLDMMRHALERYGVSSEKINFVDEHYTSRTCHRCSITEFRKFKNQSNMRKYGKVFRHGGYFECLDCGWKGNADVNGAINIGRQFMITKLFKTDDKEFKQELNRCRRRNHWWVAEELYQRRLWKYEHLDTETKQKKEKPVKHSDDEWEVVRKQTIWKLRKLPWYRYPTTHVPNVWLVWLGSIQTAKPVPILMENQ